MAQTHFRRGQPALIIALRSFETNSWAPAVRHLSPEKRLVHLAHAYHLREEAAFAALAVASLAAILMAFI